MDNDRSKHKEGIQELDRHSRLNNDVELQKRSTLWENLKSLADTIVNIWRK
uniref:Uncharacterized protein n=1 Tax=Rhizophora mucronata TaxID=61149 RepID=A0A2P2KFQ7_RHIMU